MGNKAFWDEVENIMHFKEGSILDVACGDGRSALFLLENKFKLTGVDFSAKAIDLYF
jgi:ubiquinone/menaquinone biosynthesis C-methylase UbiE